MRSHNLVEESGMGVRYTKSLLESSEPEFFAVCPHCLGTDTAAQSECFYCGGVGKTKRALTETVPYYLNTEANFYHLIATCCDIRVGVKPDRIKPTIIRFLLKMDFDSQVLSFSVEEDIHFKVEQLTHCNVITVCFDDIFAGIVTNAKSMDELRKSKGLFKLLYDLRDSVIGIFDFTSHVPKTHLPRILRDWLDYLISNSESTYKYYSYWGFRNTTQMLMRRMVIPENVYELKAVVNSMNDFNHIQCALGNFVQGGSTQTFLDLAFMLVRTGKHGDKLLLEVEEVFIYSSALTEDIVIKTDSGEDVTVKFVTRANAEKVTLGSVVIMPEEFLCKNDTVFDYEKIFTAATRIYL